MTGRDRVLSRLPTLPLGAGKVQGSLNGPFAANHNTDQLRLRRMMTVPFLLQARPGNKLLATAT